MATLIFQFSPEPSYNGTYRAIAYTVAAPTVPVSQQDFFPAFADPTIGGLTVPTFEPHIVKIFAVKCNNALVGTLLIPVPVAGCQAPTNIVFSNITSDAADVVWTAPAMPPSGGYIYEVYTVMSGVETLAQVGTTLYTSTILSTLQPSMQYRLKVRSDCGGTESINTTAEFTTDPVGHITFRNVMSVASVTSLTIDGGSNILAPGAVIWPGADFQYSGVISGTHSIEADFTGLPNDDQERTQQIRGGVVINNGSMTYVGAPLTLLTATFLAGDIFQIENWP